MAKQSLRTPYQQFVVMRLILIDSLDGETIVENAVTIRRQIASFNIGITINIIIIKTLGRLGGTTP